MLSERASGLRHLRWAREIVASLEAFAAGCGGLSEEAEEAMREEAARLKALVQRLSGAVKPYRDFLERTRVGFRGRERALRFARDAARLDAHREATERMERDERGPLKAALRGAIAELRAELLEMNERLRARGLGGALESVYPPLARGGTRVADDADEDDDASAPA